MGKGLSRSLLKAPMKYSLTLAQGNASAICWRISEVVVEFPNNSPRQRELLELSCYQ